MDAAEAERRGLVSRVVPAADLMQTATAMARGIANSSRMAIAKAKECVQRAEELSLAEGLIFEQCVLDLPLLIVRAMLAIPGPCTDSRASNQAQCMLGVSTSVTGAAGGQLVLHHWSPNQGIVGPRIRVTPV